MVYDCFMFYNELELLELRLHELDEIVDKFVLVEATKTLSGQPKPLFFYENRERFRVFTDKIIHIVVDDMPMGSTPRDHWLREHFQRNSIARGLVNCRPQDLVMVSDIDEIPNAQTLVQFSANIKFHDDFFSNLLHKAFNSQLTQSLFHRKTLRHILRKHHPFVWKLEQFPCGLYLNRRSMDQKWWYGTRIMYFRDFTVAEEIRYSGYKIVKNGGWHFSYMGDVNRIKTKIESYAHQELNNPTSIQNILNLTSKEQLSQDLRLGKIELLPNSVLPQYVRNNRDKFLSWLIDPEIASEA